jgi:Protein of unknown function (DUF2829)
MNYQEALEAMIEGKYVARESWKDQAKYCVLMPGMPFVWLIQTIPNPNAGVWMGTVEDQKAEDWVSISNDDIKPVEATPVTSSQAA